MKPPSQSRFARHLTPAPRGRGTQAEGALAAKLRFLSPVERGRGAERSEADWGSTSWTPSEVAA